MIFIKIKTAVVSTNQVVNCNLWISKCRAEFGQHRPHVSLV